jgi:pyruvate dehydrogenase E1 component alpha subunit
MDGASPKHLDLEEESSLVGPSEEVAGSTEHESSGPEDEWRESSSCLLSDEQLQEALRYMILSRILDERAISFQRQGRAGTHAPAVGQEAAVVGSALAVDPARDWIVPQYRENAAYIRHGVPIESFWLARMGWGQAGTVPEEVRVLPAQIAIAAQLPHAVGLAWGLRLRGEDSVVLAYVGDGGTSEGDFHEAANLAGVQNAPIVFVCQNNRWAISTPVRKQTATSSIASRAIGYGFPGMRVNGNDILAVYEATVTAVDRARRREGPTLIEAVTYRLGMHNTSDDPGRYMGSDELAAWGQRDPIERLRKVMRSKGLWDESAEKEMTSEAEHRIDAAWTKAGEIAAAIDPVDVVFGNVYADSGPRLRSQESELRSLRA